MIAVHYMIHIISDCEISIILMEVSSAPLWKSLDFCGISTNTFECSMILVGVPLVHLWGSLYLYGIPTSTFMGIP